MVVVSAAHAQQTVSSSVDVGQNEESGVRPGHVASQLTRLISLVVTDSTVEYIVNEIGRLAKLKVVYGKLKHELAQRKSVRFDRVPAADAFSKALRGTGLSVSFASDGETVVIRPQLDSTPKPNHDSIVSVVSGSVVDSATGSPLIGASVAIKSVQRSVTTSSEGRFELKRIPRGTHVLTVNLFGYRPVSREIVVGDGGMKPIRLSLSPTATMLSGVVTTVTGAQRKLEIGNSIASINVDSVMRVAPVLTVTDLLEHRVPGLVVQRSSGQPGDPSRIRIRGASSVYNSNDPIVVVDGIRLDVAHTEFQGGTSVRGLRQMNADVGGQQYLASTPLDQIDPNSIETIDVFKGPSAAAIYGSDGANGVIIITTKHGRPGPALINATVTYGIAQLPGTFPEQQFPFGRMLGLLESTCSPVFTPGCEVDSVISYQALNDPYYNVVGTGHERGLTMSVSGGSGAFNYSLTGSHSNQIGYVRMSRFLRDWFYANQLGAISGWMSRPDRYTTWSGNARVSARVSPTLNVEVGTRLNGSTQRKAALGQSAIPFWGTTYRPDIVNSNQSDLAKMFETMERAQSGQSNSLNVSWTRFPRLPITATAGIDTRKTDDESALPRGQDRASRDSLGRYGFGQGTTRMITFNSRSNTRIVNDRIALAVGINMVKNSREDVRGTTKALSVGVERPSIGFDSVRQQRSETTLFGWYIEPKLNVSSRFFVMPGIRIDNNGSATTQNLLRLPKMNMSWIASDYDRFPWKNTIDLLRLRGAFGMAGVRNRITDRLRTFQYTEGGYTDSRYSQIIVLGALGNTQLRPERSHEFEGGFDLDLKGGRLNLEVTQYRKVRQDAILDVPLPPSVMVRSAGTIKANVGVIRNSGLEVSASARIIESSGYGWSSTLQFSQNTNVVTRLDRSQVSWSIAENMMSNTASRRVVAGYPLWGVWAVPLLGYEDMDHNGVITESEIILGDSMQYLGQQEPRGSWVSSNTLTFLHGLVSFNTSMSYQYGMSQIAAWMGRAFLSKVNVSPLENALALTAGISAYPLVQEVNTFRIESMSVQTQISDAIIRRLGVRNASVALQASNVWMRSNYMGKDPNVNSAMMANTTVDIGTLAQPRRWTLRCSVGF